MQRTNGLALLDGIFVIASLAAMCVLCNLPNGDHRQNTVMALLVPIAYTVLSSLITRNNVAVASSRAYLMCFILAVCTGGDSVSRLILRSTSLLESTSEKSGEEAVFLLYHAADLIPFLTLPMVVGIGIYLVSSVFEHQAVKTSTTSSASATSQPAHTSATVENVLAIQESYHGLAHTIQSVNTAVAQWNERFQSSSKAIEKLSDNANKASANLEKMIASVVVSKEQSQVIARSVLEVRSVLEEFSELTAKGI